MTRSDLLFVSLVAMAGGLVGGAASERWSTQGLAIAQPRTNSVNAGEFVLLDRNGTPRAGLGLDQNGEVGLVLTSKDGSRKLALSPDGRLALKLTDNDGKVLWAAP
jgi:hypothetical protein